MRAAQLGEGGAEILLHRRCNIADAKSITVSTNQSPDLGHRGIVICKQPFRFLRKCVAAAGRPHAGGSPFKYTSAKVIFKLLELAGNGRLRNVQTLDDATKSAFLEDDQKQTELVQHGRSVMRKPHHGNLQSAL